VVTIDMGRKQGADVPLSRGGELGPHPTSAPRSTSVPVASSSIHQFGHNRHGPKTGGLAPFRTSRDPSNTTSPGPRHLGPSIRLATIDIEIGWGLCPFFLGEDGSPSNTKSPGLRPTSIPSGILIMPHGHWPKIGGCAL